MHLLKWLVANAEIFFSKIMVMSACQVAHPWWSVSRFPRYEDPNWLERCSLVKENHCLQENYQDEAHNGVQLSTEACLRRTRISYFLDPHGITNSLRSFHLSWPSSSPSWSPSQGSMCGNTSTRLSPPSQISNCRTTSSRSFANSWILFLSHCRFLRLSASTGPVPYISLSQRIYPFRSSPAAVASNSCSGKRYVSAFTSQRYADPGYSQGAIVSHGPLSWW